MDPVKYYEHIRSVILSVYKGQMIDVLLLLTFNTILSWAPYALVDYILYVYTDLTIAVINNIDFVIVPIITFFFIKFSKRFLAWYSDLKAKQDEEQEALLNRVTELDMVTNDDNAVMSTLHVDNKA